MALIILVLVIFSIKVKKIRHGHIQRYKNAVENKVTDGDLFPIEKLPENFFYLDKKFYISLKDVYVRKNDILNELGKTSEAEKVNETLYALKDKSGLGSGAYEKIYKTKFDDVFSTKDKTEFGGEVFTCEPSKYRLNINDPNNKFYIIEDPDERILHVKKIKKSKDFIKVSTLAGGINAMLIVDTEHLRYVLPAGISRDGNISFKFKEEYLMFQSN